MKTLRMAALAAALALAACSQQTAPAPGAPAATPNATSAAAAASDASVDKALKDWSGTYEINFATDEGPKQGGGDVIWNKDPKAQNVVVLKRSEFSLGGLETYECTPDTNATAAWQNCLFIRVGTRPMKRPDLANHPLPVHTWNKSKPEESQKEVEPIAQAALTGLVGPETERLVSSFVKDGKVEYLVLYRIYDGIRNGDTTQDLLLINLRDRDVGGLKAFENGWGTGGKKP